jgi:hypothetical protein
VPAAREAQTPAFHCSFVESVTISPCTRHALRQGMKSDASFRDLKVWRDAMTPVEDVYRITKGFRADERFGLTAQLRRAAMG